MRKLYVIGIGAGDPDQVTVQAIRAMNEVDVFFVIGKGDRKQELVDVRDQILATHVGTPYRIVEIPDPPRAQGEPADDAAYVGAVEDWHERRALRLRDEFEKVDGVGAVLVWGDPSLYDGTLRVVERIRAAGTRFECEVIPGVTSVQALGARHATVLNRVAEPVLFTTGRRLREEGLGDRSTVVMLDAECSFTAIEGNDVHIWWGAYLGMPDEVVLAGPLPDIAEEIVRTRTELRERKGWIMDTYLLRRDG